MRIFLAAISFFCLQGCVASVVTGVITAPIKVVSKTADVLTTSQSEADENRGRALRKREGQIAKLERERDKQQEKCDDGKNEACDRVAGIKAEIAHLKGL